MKLKHLAASLFLLLASFSCSEYGKVLESDDYDLQYESALKYYHAGKYNKALTLFSSVENIFTGTEKIDTIKFYSASAWYKRGTSFDTSAELFDQFRKNYTRSPFVEAATYFYAMSYYRNAPNSELDQSYAVKAIEAFADFVYRYPESSYVEQCNAMIDELANRVHDKAFYVGETYYKIGYHKSAVTTLRNILKNNPETPMREEILYLILKTQYSYAKSSIPSKQKERFYDVIDSYYSITSQFPESKYSKICQRLYENADAIVKGDAIVDDYSSEIIRQHDKVYKRKERIEDKMLTEDTKGDKANKEKLLKLRDKLDKVEAEIQRLEDLQENAR